jgi:RNA polymerase sigma-70 factor (ECF subfamily)
LDKARGGDIPAFEALVKKYQEKIYGLAHHVCAGLRSEAEDVYQETLISAFKNIKKFKGKSGFGTWVYRIAANNCWMKFRKKKAEKLVSMEDLKGLEDIAQVDELAKKELSDSVAKALAKLSVDQRLAITLADIQGVSMEEGAKILKISVPAFKTRLFRARAALRGVI